MALFVTDSIEALKILTPTTEAWQLIYQDEQFLVVNKPAMLLTVPGRHPANFDCLISRVQQHVDGMAPDRLAFSFLRELACSQLNVKVPRNVETAPSICKRRCPQSRVGSRRTIVQELRAFRNCLHAAHELAMKAATSAQPPRNASAQDFLWSSSTASWIMVPLQPHFRCAGAWKRPRQADDEVEGPKADHRLRQVATQP